MKTRSSKSSPVLALVSATAALMISPLPPMATALLSNHNVRTQRPSFLHLGSMRSELDILTARRLEILRRHNPDADQDESESPLITGIGMHEIIIDNSDYDDDLSDDDIIGESLEYFYDTPDDVRDSDDFFHIILLGSSFQREGISIDFAAARCEDILQMPVEEARELSVFAKHQGFSCLGTWTREECLSLGKKLQSQDLICRVIPFIEDRESSWQAKLADSFPSDSLREDVAYLQGLMSASDVPQLEPAIR